MTAPERVLFVTTECSADPRSGGEIRTFELAAALCERAAVEVVVVTETDSEALRERLGASAVVVPSGRPGRFRVAARALVRGWPITSARWWHRDVAALVRRRSREGAVIVLDHVYLDVYRPRTGDYVLSLHNVETSVQRSLPYPRGTARRLARRWELLTLARLERRAARRPRARLVAVSGADAVMLGGRATVVENGARLPVSPPGRPPKGLLLFVGSMTWAPNREAISWWLEEVQPKIRGSLPPLTVVGRGGREHFAEDDRLDVRGEVPSMEEVMSQTRVVVVPLRHGGGTRLKVLEALAWMRPVVASSKGAEGLRVRDGQELLIADEGGAFARAVEVLYDNDELADRLCNQGRRVAETYDWKILGGRFAAVVLGVKT